MPSEQNLAAMIVAAGYSSRMQDFKPLLPLGNSTMLETSINKFREANIHDIVVVLGHRANDLRPLVERSGVKWVVNAMYDEGMYSSITTGLQSLTERVKACFLLPADMPLVKSQTIRELIMAYNKVEATVVYPVLNGRRGHPPLISSSLFPAILAWQGQGGLRQVLRQYQAQAREVEVVDEAIFMDADTPADYANLCQVYAQRNTAIA